MRNATKHLSRAPSTSKLTLQRIDDFISSGCVLHPLVSVEYLHLLQELERKGKISLTAATRLQLHALRFPCRKPLRKTA